MKVLNRKDILIKSSQSFFATWALMKASRMEVGNILTFVFFLLCFFFFCHIDTRLSISGFNSGRRTRLTAAAISLVFSALYMAVDYPFYVQDLTSPLFRTGIVKQSWKNYYLKMKKKFQARSAYSTVHTLGFLHS